MAAKYPVAVSNISVGTSYTTIITHSDSQGLFENFAFTLKNTGAVALSDLRLQISHKGGPLVSLVDSDWVTLLMSTDWETATDTLRVSSLNSVSDTTVDVPATCAAAKRCFARVNVVAFSHLRLQAKVASGTTTVDCDGLAS